MKPELVSQYVQTGKVKFEYRDFQFIGKESQRAAQGADCAAKQGRFWQFHDTLYANQQAENSGAITDGYLQAIARKMGLDLSRFNQCLNSPASAQQVQDSYNEAVNQLHLTGTPSIFVNGRKLSDASWSTLQSAIEAALKK